MDKGRLWDEPLEKELKKKGQKNKGKGRIAIAEKSK